MQFVLLQSEQGTAGPRDLVFSVSKQNLQNIRPQHAVARRRVMMKGSLVVVVSYIVLSMHLVIDPSPNNSLDTRYSYG